MCVQINNIFLIYRLTRGTTAVASQAS